MESNETSSAAGIVPGTHVESAFESGESGASSFGSGPRSEPKCGRSRHVHSPQSTWADSRVDARPPGPIAIVQSYGAVWSTAGEAAWESGPPSEPKHGRLRHVNSPQSRWADSRRDARPPGPIVIVQSYGAVWSTEKHNPKQDLRVCEEEPSAVWSTPARNRTGNAELRAHRSNYRAPDLRISRRKTQDCAVSTRRQRRTCVSVAEARTLLLRFGRSKNDCKAVFAHIFVKPSAKTKKKSLFSKDKRSFGLSQVASHNVPMQGGQKFNARRCFTATSRIDTKFGTDFIWTETKRATSSDPKSNRGVYYEKSS